MSLGYGNTPVNSWIISGDKLQAMMLEFLEVFQTQISRQLGYKKKNRGD